MKNIHSKRNLQIVLIVLIVTITLGIGYASISAINLIINGNATASSNQENFNVYFVQTADTPSLTGNVILTGSATIDSEDNKVAHFNVSGLTKVGDYAIATYTIINNSNGVGAYISLDLINSNSEYFKVTETITDNKLQAGDTTTGMIKVELIKTPIENDASTSVTGTLTASPLENATASGGEQKIEVRPVIDSHVYSVNDWHSPNVIGQELVGNPLTFNEAKMSFGHPAAIAHITSNNIIESSYVAFERNGTIYYLRGGAGNEFGQASMPIYDANVAELKKAFGGEGVWQGYCTETEKSDNINFKCTDNGLELGAFTDGSVGIIGLNWTCDIETQGYSSCNTDN